MNLNKWIWFNVSGDINAVLVSNLLNKINIKNGLYNIRLIKQIEAIWFHNSIFPITFAFDEHIIDNKLIYNKNFNEINQNWSCRFYIKNNYNKIKINNEKKIFDFESTNLFSEYINNIKKIVQSLNFKFLFCFFGSDYGEINLEFSLLKINNLFELISKLSILRAALEDSALSRGLILKKCKIIDPINSLIDNNLFAILPLLY